MIKDLNKICVFNKESEDSEGTGFNIQTINIEDKSLSEFADIVEIPRDPSLFDPEELVKNKRYRLDNSFVDNPEVKIVNKLIQEIETNSRSHVLSSVKDIFSDSDKEMLYKGIAYMAEEKTNEYTTKHFYIFPLKRTQNVIDKHKFLIFFKDSLGDRTAKTSDFDDGLDMPISDCICHFISKETTSGEKTITLDMFDCFEFDKQFDMAEITKKYADNVIEQFNAKKFKLTSDNIKVIIDPSLSSDSIGNIKLLRAIAGFNNHGRRTIKKVSGEQLGALLNMLESEAKKNAGADFNVKNIPIIDDDALKVTSDSIGIFASLLENKIIEKLLTGEINVPYV